MFRKMLGEKATCLQPRGQRFPPRPRCVAAVLQSHATAVPRNVSTAAHGRLAFAALGALAILGMKQGRRKPVRAEVEELHGTSRAQKGRGSAEFWTLLYFGESQSIAALRNVVEQHEDGLYYRKLCQAERGAEGLPTSCVRVRPGDGFGQFCRLTPAAEERLLRQFKSVTGVLGQSNGGVEIVEASDAEALLEALRSRNEASIVHHGNIEAFQDVSSYQMPLKFENNFKIHLCPMRSQQDLQQQLGENRMAAMKRLSFGLPSSCDAFRSAAFTGDSHGLGIVPAINEQQFVLGTDTSDTWVRFDQADLERYEYHLEGIPVLRDDRAIFFPATHLWVNFNFPTAAYSLEWFYGTQCIVRREFSLWPLPKALMDRMVKMTLGHLQNMA